MYKRSKRFLAAGLATTVILSSMIIPAAAAEDYAGISLSARIEEYIAETDTTDPVAELLGEDTVLNAERNVTPALTASGVGLAGVVNSAENVIQSINRIQNKNVSETAKDEEVAKAEESAPVYNGVENNVSVLNKEEATVAEAEEENTTEANETENAENKEEKAEEAKAEVKYPQFEDRCIVTLKSGVLNIRESADKNAKVVGQIESAGIALVEEKGAAWTKIGSGNCEGYAATEYLAFGDDAGAWAENNNVSKYVKVLASGLRVRDKADKDGEVLASLFANETYDVIQDGSEWVKIRVSDKTTGYVSADYVEVRFNTPKAKTMAQIEAAKKAEEDAKRKAEEQKKAEAEAAKKAKEAEAKKTETKTETKKSETKKTETKTETKKTETETKSETKQETKTTEETPVKSTNSNLRAEMIAYAKQFLGNPYKYGGTSLTNGTDCSGFTMRIYEHFGYKIPRAGGQRTFGKRIKVSEAQPGDLIFYPGHVTMYIGGGQVIHASSERTGIIISSLTYSGTAEFATNIIDYYN